MKRLWIAVHLATLWCAVLSLAPAMATQAVDPATAADAALGLGGRQRLRRLLILLLLLVVVQLLVLVVRQRSASMPSWRQCAWTKEVSGEALREDLENTLSQNSYTRRARGHLKVA